MSNYPERPAKKKVKSSQSGGGKRRTWLSACDKIEQGRDVSPKVSPRFEDIPICRDARLKKQRQLWPTKGKAYG